MSLLLCITCWASCGMESVLMIFSALLSGSHTQSRFCLKPDRVYAWAAVGFFWTENIHVIDGFAHILGDGSRCQRKEEHKTYTATGEYPAPGCPYFPSL